MFDRSQYYSKTEILKTFNIKKSELEEILKDMPQVNKEVDLGGYTIITCYVLRENIDRLGWSLKTE